MRALFIAISAAVLVPVGVYCQAGSLDSDFDADGTVTTVFVNSTSSNAAAIAVQADGKIVVAGAANFGGTEKNNFVITRYNIDGTLDNTFSSDGKVSIDFGGQDYLTDIAIQTDGKIVLVGSTSGTDESFAIARLKANGTMDNSFNGNGKLIFDFSGNLSADLISAVAIQSDGKIVVAGTANSAFAVARFTTSGVVDSSFGNNGKATAGFGVGTTSSSSAIALQADGKIVVGGACYGTNIDFALCRYTVNGSLDNTFSLDGKTTTDVSGIPETIRAVAIQPDGKIVACGTSNGADLALARYQPDGFLDLSFSGDGKLLTDFNGNSETGECMVLQPDGKILVGGVQNGGAALVRYNTDGSLDNTFDGDGLTTTSLINKAADLALQADGRIVVAGFSGAPQVFAAARFLSGLSLGLTDFVDNQVKLVVYPNPVADNAVAEYELNSEERITISLLDINGRVVQTIVEHEFQRRGKHQIVLPMAPLMAGTYLLSISNGSGAVSTRFVK